MAEVIGTQGSLRAKPMDHVVFKPNATMPVALDGVHTTYFKKDVPITIERPVALRLEAAKRGTILGTPAEVAAKAHKQSPAGETPEQKEAREKAEALEAEEAAKREQAAKNAPPLTPAQVTVKAQLINLGKDELVARAAKAKLGPAAALAKLTKDQLADALARK